MFALKDDNERSLLLPMDKNKHAAHGSLTAFVPIPVSCLVPGAAVLFVPVVMGGLDGSFGLPTSITTTVMMAAVATKTNPSITTLNLRDILDQPCASLLITMTSEAGTGKASYTGFSGTSCISVASNRGRDC
jgi:hypothetical protein